MDNIKIQILGYTDPYGQAVKDYLNLVSDRLPCDEVLDRVAAIEALTAPGKSHIHTHDAITHGVYELAIFIKSFTIPLRDKSLIEASYSRVLEMKKVITLEKIHAQKVLEEFCETHEHFDRSVLFELFELRDKIFKQAHNPSLVKAFYEALKTTKKKQSKKYSKVSFVTTPAFSR